MPEHKGIRTYIIHRSADRHQCLLNYSTRWIRTLAETARPVAQPPDRQQTVWTLDRTCTKQKIPWPCSKSNLDLPARRLSLLFLS